jgi:Protein of unknown function (DUF2637)
MIDSTVEGAAGSSGDRWIRRMTTVAVVVLAGIAAAVSYGHMHGLARLHGEAAWSARLVPVSVNGMIVVSSLALLADSRAGRRGGILPWCLLVVGSGASLAANVAVAEATVYGRVIAAWPSFALIGAYELLMRQIRQLCVLSCAASQGSPVRPAQSRSHCSSSRRLLARRRDKTPDRVPWYRPGRQRVPLKMRKPCCRVASDLSWHPRTRPTELLFSPRTSTEATDS